MDVEYATGMRLIFAKTGKEIPFLGIRLGPQLAALLCLLTAAVSYGQSTAVSATEPDSLQDCSLAGKSLEFDPFIWDTDFCKHSVPIEEFASGGPPRDAIPPLHFPSYVPAAAAEAWLEDVEPVVLLEYGSEVRAYPIQILIWHEVVNDSLGDLPVVVTFCPLCYSAIVFERPVVDGEELTFGTSGNLRYNDLVMWDYQTHSWWQQFSGEALVGRMTGTKLRRIPASIASWRTVREHHPDALVLSRNTGFNRQYGRNPYSHYDRPDYRYPELEHLIRPPLPAMERVVGIETENAAKAYRLEDVQQLQVIPDRLGDVPTVIFWRPGAVTAVDDPVLVAGRPIGETHVFSRLLDGRTLDFEPLGDATFRDRQTGTRWSILGEGVSGPLAGRRLEPLIHYDIFWFVWSVFKPDAPLFVTDQTDGRWTD